MSWKDLVYYFRGGGDFGFRGWWQGGYRGALDVAGEALDLRDKAVLDEFYGCEEIAVTACVATGRTRRHRTVGDRGTAGLRHHRGHARMKEHSHDLVDEVNKLANAVRTSDTPEDVATQVRMLAALARRSSNRARGRGLCRRAARTSRRRNVLRHPGDIQKTIPYSPILESSIQLQDKRGPRFETTRCEEL